MKGHAGKALLAVSAELFVSALMSDHGQPKSFRVVENPLPDDVRVVGLHALGDHSLLIEIESESYPPLEAREYHLGLPVVSPPRLQVWYPDPEEKS